MKATEAKLLDFASLQDLPPAMGLVRQFYERQRGNGGDA